MSRQNRMRLAIPSLVLFIYLVASLVVFVPCRPLVKTMVGIALFAISLKYLIYEKIGGSFIAPDLPRTLLLSMEILYSSSIILAFLLVLKDGLALLLWLSRCLGSSWHLPFTPAMRSGGLVVAALALGIYGTWQSMRVPDVRTVEITLPKLPVSLDGFSIVQLTDLHIGPFSGHTHGGHLFFLKWLISAFNGGLVEGLYNMGGRKLYVSPGTGIWAGFSCRVGVPSEITHIILRSQAKG